jgi:hypothetical protein
MYYPSWTPQGSIKIYLFWNDSKLKPIRNRKIVSRYAMLLPLHTHKVELNLPYVDFYHVGEMDFCLYNDNTNYPDVKSTAMLMLLPEHQILDEVIKSNSFIITLIDEK